MKKLLVALALGLCGSAFGQGWQGTWKWQSPAPSLNPLTYFSFVDSLTGYGVACANRNQAIMGALFKTTDGGERWKKLSEGRHFYSVHELVFPSPRTGWAVLGDYRKGMKSTDSGRTWVDAEIDRSTSLWVRSFKFINENVGFALTHHLSSDLPRLYRTTNGGRSWTMVMTLQRNFSVGLVSISFPTASVGYLSGNQALLAKSTDGGATWQLQQNPWDGGYIYGNIFFLNDSTGWMTRGSALFHTTNGGASWNLRSTAVLAGVTGLRDMHFTDMTRGRVYGTLNGGTRVLQTNDGGVTWRCSEPVPTYLSNGKPGFLSHRSWITASNLGTLLKTNDSGKIYRNLNLQLPDLSSVHFSNDYQGWAVGDHQTIVRTRDGGRNWQIVHDVPADPNPLAARRLFSVHAFGDTAWAVGEIGLLKTTNGGSSWEKDSTHKGRHILFLNPQLGWIRGDTGMWMTTTGGQTWKLMNQDVRFRTVQFLNPSLGYAGGFEGLFRTNDSGRTWTQVLDRILVHSVCFADSLTGFAAGQGHFGRNLYKTTDGGLNWTETMDQPSGSGWIIAIGFSDTANGWACTPKGMWNTRNGGRSWTIYPGEWSYTFKIQVNPSGHAWYVHGKGGIAHYPEDLPPLPVPVINRNLIEGRVYIPRDSNCLSNPGEKGMPNSIVRVDPGPYFANTNHLGEYRIRVRDSGTYRVSQVLSRTNSVMPRQLCPDQGQVHSIRFDSVADQAASNVNFGNHLPICPVLHVSVGSNRRRPCFTSITYIAYSNTGTDTAKNVTAFLQLPPEIRLVSSQHPYEADLAQGIYKFPIGNVPHGSSGTIAIKDSMICDNSLVGSMFCLKAWLSPGNRLAQFGGCVPNPPGYDGSDISVRAHCVQDTTAFFSIKNRGSSMSASRLYRVYLDTTLTLQNLYRLGAGDSLVFSVPRRGQQRMQFVRVEANQDPLHPTSRMASANAGCFLTAPPPGSLAEHSGFPADEESLVYGVGCMTAVNSSDPNDKLVFPKGIGEQGNILAETQLEYKIRFQNTGTDTAYTVRIEDTLSTDLDIATLELGTSSHKADVSVSGQGLPVVTFSFSDIKLVDSTHNEPQSHGYVSFRIRPKKALLLGTRISNKADIYFDYNEPVRTNTTLNTLYEPQINPGIIDSVHMVPNNDLAAMPAPGLTPAYLTGCWHHTAVPVYLVAANRGMDNRPGTDTVAIRLRDEQTGLSQTHLLPLMRTLRKGDSVTLAIPYPFTEARAYRLWARIRLAGDAVSANDSALIELPYGAVSVPHSFTFDTCRPGALAPVRGFAFEEEVSGRTQPGGWEATASGGQGHVSWFAPDTGSGPATGRLVTLPVGPLGRNPVLKLRWQVQLHPSLLPDDRLRVYAHSACLGRRLVHEVTAADTAAWPASGFGTTLVRLDTVPGLGADSAAAFEVEFQLAAGRGPAAQAWVQVDDITLLDSLMVGTAPAMARPAVLQVQPNPARNSVAITSPRTGTVMLVNAQGKTMALVSVQAHKPVDLQVESLPPGMYFLKQGEMALRLIKE